MRRFSLILLFMLMTVSGAAAQGVDGTQVVFGVTLPVGEFEAEDVRATAAIIAQRLAALEVEAYQVQIVDGRSIQVQFTDDDSQAIIDALTQTALLELVDLSDEPATAPGTFLTTSAAPERDGLLNSLTDEPFATIITGADFQAVEAYLDPDFDNWNISFELTDEAGEIFGAFTEAHIGKAIGIALDGVLISAPIVQARLDSAGVISGNFTQEEAERLAAQLRAGALPLPLVVKSMSTIETIDQEIS